MHITAFQSLEHASRISISQGNIHGLVFVNSAGYHLLTHNCVYVYTAYGDKLVCLNHPNQNHTLPAHDWTLLTP